LSKKRPSQCKFQDEADVKDIIGFFGPYRFLSNFSPSEVTISLREGSDTLLICHTVEHGFQASKALNPSERQWVTQAPTAGVAKRRGRAVKLRPDWEIVKVDVMLALLRQKFAFGTELGAKLLDTEDAQLVEENHWGDRYWGTVRGAGENMLGKCLMQVRAELQALETSQHSST
jgi:ribA/ribD-fused uncharacterized protein